jgi:hypothetical protein
MVDGMPLPPITAPAGEGGRAPSPHPNATATGRASGSAPVPAHVSSNAPRPDGGRPIASNTTAAGPRAGANDARHAPETIDASIARRIDGDAQRPGPAPKPRPPVTDAATLDRAVPPARRRQLVEQQRELEARLRAQRPKDADGRPRPIPTRPTVGTIDLHLGPGGTPRAQAEAAHYYETHRYAVVDGDVYAVTGYDESTGRATLERTDEPVEPPASMPGRAGTSGSASADSEVTIEPITGRTHVTTVTTAPASMLPPRTHLAVTDESWSVDGERRESTQRVDLRQRRGDTRMQTVVTTERGPNGSVTGSRKVVEARTPQGEGDEDRLRAEYAYRADGSLATQSQAAIEVRGPVTRTEREQQSWDRAGVLLERTRGHEEQGPFGFSSSSATDTFEDGRRSTRTVVDNASDGNGSIAVTSYDGSGDPRSTLVSRSGSQVRRIDDEDPASARPERELLLWGDDGDLAGAFVADPARTLDEQQRTLERAADDYQRTGRIADELHAPLTGVIPIDDDRGEGRAVTAADYERDGDNHFVVRGTSSAGYPNSPIPEQDVSTSLELPASMRGELASAEAIDRSAPRPGSRAFAQLQAQQAEYRRQMSATTDPQARERIQRDYFTSHRYYVERAGGDPIVFAAGYDDASGEQGHARPEPHAVLARTDVRGAISDGTETVTSSHVYLYADGGRDDLLLVHARPDGADTSSLTIERSDGRGRIFERQVASDAIVDRRDHGERIPLHVHTVDTTDFDAAHGTPTARYRATVTDDGTHAGISERRDSFDASGSPTQTTLHEESRTANWDGQRYRAFATEEDAALAQFARGEDHVDINHDHTRIGLPAAPSSWSETDTTVTYDDGVPVRQHSDRHAVEVQASGSDGGGIIAVETVGTSDVVPTDFGDRIAGDDLRVTVPGTFVNHVTTRQFEPRASDDDPHQLRRTTRMTEAGTLLPDGTTTDTRFGPLEETVLSEQRGDDDWYFDHRLLRTDPDTGDVVTHDGAPVALGGFAGLFDPANSTYVDPESGDTVEVTDEPRHEESQDFAEELDDSWGAIQTVGAIVIAVAGVAAAPFTGAASAMAGVTTAGAILAATNAAYTGWKYADGEASGLDFGLSLAGAAISAIPGVGLAARAGERAAVEGVGLARGAGGLATRGIDEAAQAGARSASMRALARGQVIANTGLSLPGFYQVGHDVVTGKADVWTALEGLAIVSGYVAGPAINRLGRRPAGAPGAVARDLDAAARDLRSQLATGTGGGRATIHADDFVPSDLDALVVRTFGRPDGAEGRLLGRSDRLTVELGSGGRVIVEGPTTRAADGRPINNSIAPREFAAARRLAEESGRTVVLRPPTPGTRGGGRTADLIVLDAGPGEARTVDVYSPRPKEGARELDPGSVLRGIYQKRTQVGRSSAADGPELGGVVLDLGDVSPAALGKLEKRLGLEPGAYDAPTFSARVHDHLARRGDMSGLTEIHVLLPDGSLGTSRMIPTTEPTAAPPVGYRSRATDDLRPGRPGHEYVGSPAYREVPPWERGPVRQGEVPVARGQRVNLWDARAGRFVYGFVRSIDPKSGEVHVERRIDSGVERATLDPGSFILQNPASLTQQHVTTSAGVSGIVSGYDTQGHLRLALDGGGSTLVPLDSIELPRGMGTIAAPSAVHDEVNLARLDGARYFAVEVGPHGRQHVVATDLGGGTSDAAARAVATARRAAETISRQTGRPIVTDDRPMFLYLDDHDAIRGVALFKSDTDGLHFSPTSVHPMSLNEDVIVHEFGHSWVNRFLQFHELDPIEGPMLHEALADFVADRMHPGVHSGHRDITRGTGVITNYDRIARNERKLRRRPDRTKPLEPHEASGVVSVPLARIGRYFDALDGPGASSPVPIQLVDAALTRLSTWTRTGGRRPTITDFAAALRQAAGERFGYQSPEYRFVDDALSTGRLHDGRVTVR